MRFLLLMAALWPLPSTAADLRIADALRLPDDTPVVTQAVITIPPGKLSKTIFAVQDTDGRAGIFVRSFGKGELPSLSVGDSVRIAGKVSADDKMLLHTRPSGISLQSTGGPPTAHAEEIAAIVTADDGRMVEVVGSVSARGKRWIDMTDEVASREIHVSLVGPEAPMAQPGDAIMVRGVVRTKSDGTELIVINADQITITATAIDDYSGVTGAIKPSSRDEPSPTWPFLLVALGLGTASWLKNRRLAAQAKRLVDS